MSHKFANVEWYGWKEDRKDARDYKFKVPRAVLKALPTVADLRSKCSAVVDQGPLGSCTGNAVSSLHHFMQMKQQAPIIFAPSRLFVYYNARVLEGTASWDSGCEIRDGMKAIAKKGVCRETHWPYVISRFATKPKALCYTLGMKHQAITYYRVTQTLAQLKGCLAAGYPFVFGFLVYESFESDEVTNNGVVPLPDPSEELLGGHAVMAVGYEESSKRFLVRNSWGADWGLGGYFTMPYAYLANPSLSSDIWTVRLIET